MKNTTLARKPKEDMVKGAGEYKPRKTAAQAGDSADFAFNGQMGDGVNGHGTNGRHSGNPLAHLVKNPDTINHGLKQSARRGNASDSHADRMSSIGPSATKDKHQMTIATAKEGGRINGGATARGFANPDSINVGMK